MSKLAEAPVIDTEKKSDRPDPHLRLGQMPVVQAAATEALVRSFASALGLNLTDITVAIDEPAGRAVQAHGARGRAVGNVVELDPAGFHPGSVSSRALLAHEMTHAAQAQVRQGECRPSLRLAEREAAANAAAVAQGRPLSLPLERLVRPAFDAGAAGLPAVTSLSVSVARNYVRERRAIERLLDGLIVTDGEVERVLRILEPLAFETAAELIRTLEPESRLRLIREIDTDHYDRYRSQVIAALDALSRAEIGAQDADILADLPFDGLAVHELRAVQRVYRGLSRAVQIELSEGDRKAEFKALRHTEPADYDREKARAAAAKAEEQRAPSVVLAAQDVRARVLDLSTRLLALLDDPSAEDARTALALIGDLGVVMQPDPRSEPVAQAETEAEKAVGEARAEAQKPKTAPPPAKPVVTQKPSPPSLSMAALRIIASDLDEAGAIDRLIDELPQADRRFPGLLEAFRLLMSARAADRNLALVEELLDPGWWIFGWVDDREATLAYDIVMAMPLVERERFRRLEDGKLMRRLLNELPRALRQSPDFELPDVARTADGELIEAHRLYAPGGLSDGEAELVGKTLELFRDEKEQQADPQPRLQSLLAIAMLDPAAKDAGSPRPGAVLATVVRRLDAEGLLDPFLASLPPAVLAARETWRYMAAILSARDPVLGREHIMRLLNHSKWLFFTTDSVDAGEAFLAFQLVRLLPDAERQAIAEADGGEPWSRMLTKLSNQALAEASYTFFRNELDKHGSSSIRDRLNNDELWNGKHNDRLIVLIEIARAAGDFGYVFDYSRTLYEAKRPAPTEITRRFNLYDPARKRTSPQPIEPSLETGESKTLTLIFGTGWREIETNWVTTSGPDIMGSEYRDSSISRIRVTADLEQLQDAMGGRIHNGVQVAKSGGEREKVSTKSRDNLLKSTPNIVDVLLDLENNHLTVIAPKLRLANLHFVLGSAILRTGPVSIDNLRLDVNFKKGDLIDLTAASAVVGSLGVETPVFSTADSIVAARRAILTTFNIAVGDFSDAEVREPLVGSFFGLALGIAWRHFVSGRSYIGNPLDRAPLFDKAEMSFSSFVVDEMHTSDGQQIAKTTVKGARIAAATNRAAFQRLLILSLNERLRAAADEKERAHLTKRIAAAQTELERLEPLEEEYLKLVRRMNRDEGRLSEDESKRLAELQEKEGFDVASHMGAVVDIKQIALEGIDGKVRADDFTLNNLHGEGTFRELAGFSVEQLTTEESIKRFVRFGPEAMQTHVKDKNRPQDSFVLSVGNVASNNLVAEAEIPTAASVLTAVMSLPAKPEFAKERDRLNDLATRLLIYEGLRAAPEPENAASRLAYRRRLMEERRELAALFGLSVQRLDLTDVRVGAFPGVLEPAEIAAQQAKGNGGGIRDDAGFRIGSATLDTVRYGGLAADKITGANLRGAIQLRTPGVDGLHDPDGQVEVALFGGDSITIDNARQGDSPNRAERIVIKGFDGTVRLTDAGLSIQGFVIENLSVTDAHYQTATSYLWSQGETVLRGLELDMTIPFEATASKNTDGKEENPDPAWSRLNTSIVQIQRLHIDAIEAAALGYRGFDKSGGVAKEVIVDSGTLREVDITDFTLQMPEDGEMSYAGNISVQTLEKVQFSAKMGDSFRARGVLGDGRKERGDDQPAIKIGIANSEDITVELDTVSLTEGGIDLRTASGKGRVLVRRADISGEIGLVGNAIQVRSLRIPDLDMPLIEWKTKDGATLKATKAHLLDLRLRLNYITESETRSTVELKELFIGAFRAETIDYDDGKGFTVTLMEEFTVEGHQPFIKGLLLQDLTVRMGPKETTLSGGHGKVERIGALANIIAEAEKGEGGGAYTQLATALVAASANGLTFTDFGYSSKDGLTLGGSVKEFSINGDATVGPKDPSSAPKGAMQASGDVNAQKGSIGNFRIGNGVISIGPDGSEGLVLPEITLGSLAFDGGSVALIPVASNALEAAAASGKPTSLNPSEVVAKGLTLNMDVHLRKKEDAEKAKADGNELGPVERIDIHTLHIDSIAAQGYRVYLRDKGIYIDIPAGLESTIGPIDLKGPLPDKPFSISFNPEGTKILGSAITGPLLAQQIGVQMANGLRGRLDFQAASASIGFLEASDPDSGKAGPIKINLKDWSATNILAYIGEGTSTRLRAGRDSDPAVTGTGQGVGGKGLEIDLGEDGSLGVKLRGLWARGFELRDKELGLSLNLGQVKMPDDKDLTYLSNPSKKTPGNTDHKVRIDKLDVDNADLVIMNLTNMIKTLGKGDIRAALNSRDRSADPDAPADTEASYLSGDALDWISKNEELFRSLTGSLKIDAQIEVSSIGPNVGQIHPKIDIAISEGRVDMNKFESQISDVGETFLTHGAWAVANLTFDPNKSTPTLVFGLGGHMRVSDPDDPYGGTFDDSDPSYLDLHKTFVEWPLRGDEYKIATKKNPKIGIDALLRAQDPNFGEPKDEDEEPRTDSIAEQFANLRINNFELALSTAHKSPITLHLGEYGTVTLAPNALKDLLIYGDLQKARYPNKQMEDNAVWNWLELSKTDRPGAIAMDLGSLTVSGMDIKIPAFTGFNAGTAKGGLSISDIQNLQLQFAGLVPGQLSGRIGKISLSGIEIDLEQIGLYGPEAPLPIFDYDNLPTFTEEEE